MSFSKFECPSLKWARFGMIADFDCYLHQSSRFGLRESLVGLAVSLILAFLFLTSLTLCIGLFILLWLSTGNSEKPSL